VTASLRAAITDAKPTTCPCGETRLTLARDAAPRLRVAPHPEDDALGPRGAARPRQLPTGLRCADPNLRRYTLRASLSYSLSLSADRARARAPAHSLPLEASTAARAVGAGAEEAARDFSRRRLAAPGGGSSSRPVSTPAPCSPDLSRA
jgi:hypothetical protein